MTKGTFLTPLSMVGTLLLLPLPAQAQISDPASLKRIRAALAEPPPVVQFPPPASGIPMFRVEVRQQAWTFDPLDEDAFDPTFGLPSVGELLMGGVGKIRSAAVGYKQRRAKRRARQEVADALAAFCAVHDCPATDSGK